VAVMMAPTVVMAPVPAIVTTAAPTVMMAATDVMTPAVSMSLSASDLNDFTVGATQCMWRCHRHG